MTSKSLSGNPTGKQTPPGQSLAPSQQQPHGVQAPADGMWTRPGSLQPPQQQQQQQQQHQHQHNLSTVPQGGGSSRGLPIGIGHANRVSTVVAGMEDQRSPQRRDSFDPKPEPTAVRVLRVVAAVRPVVRVEHWS